MRFEELSLDPCILAGVESAGFTTLTPIQEQAIPVVLRERDLLGLAQTGTGKTAAVGPGVQINAGASEAVFSPSFKIGESRGSSPAATHSSIR